MSDTVPKMDEGKLWRNDQLVLLQRDLDESQSMFRFEVHAFEGAEGAMEANREEYYTYLLQSENAVQDYTA